LIDGLSSNKSDLEVDLQQAQVKKMQEQSLSPDRPLDDLKYKIHELEKENKYLTVRNTICLFTDN
jgi:hypothetical protein